MSSLLQIKNLKIEFHTDQGIAKALDGVSLEIQKGKILGLVGETGCGKSITGKAILGLIPHPQGRIVSGHILFEERDICQAPPKELRSIRGGKISMIFQDPFTSLNPVYTIGNQISEAIELHQGLNKKEAFNQTINIMQKVGIPEALTRAEDYPHQFSGGMRQRAMIAMALSCNPLMLIADEPTTALDVSMQAQILELIFDLAQKTQTTVLLISHDLGVISEMCDDVAIMYAGTIVEIGAMETFFSEPRHPYSVGLLGAIPRIKERKETLSVIPGNVPQLINPPSGCRFHPRCSHATDQCRREKPPLIEVSPGHMVACFRISEEPTAKPQI